jgi:hypothetical protein
MFDFLRNLTKSAEEKREEALNAYLDDALTPRRRQQFEQDLAQNADLQSELDDLRFFKQQLRQLPQRRVPRNFTLDPAVYAPPAKQPLFQFYPVLQGATVLTAFFFVVVLALGMFTQPSNEANVALAPAAESGIVAQGADTAALSAVDEEPMAEEEMMEEAAEDVEVEATAVFIPQPESMSGAASEEPMEEEAAEGAEEVMEDTSTEALTAPETPTPDEEVATGEGQAAAPPVVGTAGNEAATAVPEPTNMPLSTATVSALPRVSATASAVPDDRILPTATPLATATAVFPSDEDTQTTTMNTNSDQFYDGTRVVTSAPPADPSPPPPNALRNIQIALGILLLAFGLTTFLVRRRL